MVLAEVRVEPQWLGMVLLVLVLAIAWTGYSMSRGGATGLTVKALVAEIAMFFIVLSAVVDGETLVLGG